MMNDEERFTLVETICAQRSELLQNTGIGKSYSKRN